MSETLPNPPSTEKAPAPGLPPSNPKALITTALAVLKAPAEFFKSIKDEKGFQKVVIFSVAMYVVNGVCSMVWPLLRGWVGGAITNLVVALISEFIAPFIGGIVIWAICLAFGSKATWERAVPIAGYSTAVVLGFAVGALIPYVGFLVQLAAGLYGLYIMWVGAKALMFEPAPTATPSP